MRAGAGADADTPHVGPLAGLRVLALEQMQALPFGTQLLARLGADVVKVEHPQAGDLGRGSMPAMVDPQGRSVGATFLRNNLGKRSVCIDLKTQAGRDLVLQLAPRFDVVCENFKGGALARLGLGYEDVKAVHPAVVYLSISGFGNTTSSPYGAWPAYAGVAEAMSGLYEWKRLPGQPPAVSPMGALGDIGTSLFGVIGLLAALRERDATGMGQYVDVAMFDSMVAFADVVTNYWSMGERPEPGQGPKMILDGFPAADGWFIVQIGREHEFHRFATLVGHPEWISDPRFGSRAGWRENITVLREGIAGWAADKTSVQACHALAAAGVASGPVFDAAQVIADPHLAERNMMIEIERTDGVADPVLTPGNPVKLSGLVESAPTRPPWLGEHTDQVLSTELGLSPSQLSELRTAGVIA